jgi:predicted phosphodiesterase
MNTPTETDKPFIGHPRRVYAYTSDHGVTSLGGGYPAIQTSVANLMKGLGAELYFFGGDNAYSSGTSGEVATNWAPWTDEIAAEKVYAALGNHDLDTTDGSPTTSFFTYWPGNKRYYLVEHGDTAFLILNSGYNTAGAIVEPDGIGISSTQFREAKKLISESKKRWKIGILHHSPYTSAANYRPGKTLWRIPYESLGLDLLLSGHSHNYERLTVGKVAHIVAGVGGASPVAFGSVLPQSVKRITGSYGALKISVDPDSLSVSFRTTSGDELDFVELKK